MASAHRTSAKKNSASTVVFPITRPEATTMDDLQARLTTRPTEQVIAAIQALDVESVKVRMMDPVRGEGWTREHADAIEISYKNFLGIFLVFYQHGEEVLVRDLDGVRVLARPAFSPHGVHHSYFDRFNIERLDSGDDLLCGACSQAGLQ